MATKPSVQFLAIPTTDLTPLQTDVSTIENRMAVDRLRSLIATNGAYIKSQDGVADEYADETGVDATASLNETYDASGDFYSNASAGYSANLVPVMTSNTAPSGVATVSAGHTDAFKMFDSSASTSTSFNGSSTTGIATYDFGVGAGVVATQYTVQYSATEVTGRSPNSWTFDGSNNGSSWTTLNSQSGKGGGQGTKHTMQFSNTTNYRYYRLNVTSNNGTGSELHAAEIEIMGAAIPVNMTLISDTFTAQTAPSEASLVLLHQPMDSVTLNTDVLAYISRDGGTTYTQGTLASGGEYSTGINILTINGLDISAQPSGTNMKYKIVTANTKEQRFHGSWLQWS